MNNFVTAIQRCEVDQVRTMLGSGSRSGTNCLGASRTSPASAVHARPSPVGAELSTESVSSPESHSHWH